VLTGKYVFVIFFILFVIRSFRGMGVGRGEPRPVPSPDRFLRHVQTVKSFHGEDIRTVTGKSPADMLDTDPGRILLHWDSVAGGIHIG